MIEFKEVLRNVTDTVEAFIRMGFVLAHDSAMSKLGAQWKQVTTKFAQSLLPLRNLRSEHIKRLTPCLEVSQTKEVDELARKADALRAGIDMCIDGVEGACKNMLEVTAGDVVERVEFLIAVGGVVGGSIVAPDDLIGGKSSSEYAVKMHH